MAPKKLGTLAYVSIALAIGISIAVFVLSYFSLEALARQCGINPQISGLWPLCLDGVMIVCAIIRMHYSLSGGEFKLAGYTMYASTILSVLLNGYHAPGGIVSVVMFAMQPVMLFVTTEMSVRMIQDIMISKRREVAARKAAVTRKRNTTRRTKPTTKE